MVRISELPHELPNDLRIGILGKLGNIRKIPEFHRIIYSPVPSHENGNPANTSTKPVVRYSTQKLEFAPNISSETGGPAKYILI